MGIKIIKNCQLAIKRGACRDCQLVYNLKKQGYGRYCPDINYGIKIVRG